MVLLVVELLALVVGMLALDLLVFELLVAVPLLVLEWLVGGALRAAGPRTGAQGTAGKRGEAAEESHDEGGGNNGGATDAAG